MEKSRVSRQPGWIVYLCGVATSVLALYLVHVAANHGEHVMGWYGYGIIPAGALIVGVASGLGYAIGSYWMNVKLWKGFILGMVATAIVDYVAALYVTYLDILERYHASAENYSFGQYFRDICENMAFTRSGSKESGDPLGALGYLFKTLEMGGYAFGAVVPSLVLGPALLQELPVLPQEEQDSLHPCSHAETGVEAAHQERKSSRPRAAVASGGAARAAIRAASGPHAL